MDFARRQLEKYGWSDGKGLGKNENGISEALKPKLKRSVTGIGHDPASEFNEHWWSALYDKAAKNVEVKEKNGKTKRIKTIDDFTITNSTWKINRKHKDSTENEYADYFIRKAILDNGGSREEKVDSDSEEDDEKKDVFKMTDEELFAACEGRTAHKGARHGLKATGKLARIAEQEQKLLTQSKYEGYSHAKKLKNSKPEEIVEDTSLEDVKERKNKKKSKRKRCVSNENCPNVEAESQLLAKPKSKKLKNKMEDSATSEINDVDYGRKSNSEAEENETGLQETDGNESLKKVKKSKKRKSSDTELKHEEINDDNIAEESVENNVSKKKKKKKRKAED